MLDTNIITQLKEIFKLLETPVEFHMFKDATGDSAVEMEDFLKEVCSTSPLLSYSVIETDNGSGNEFSIFHGGEPTRITFRGIPGGHEFNSLLLAVLNSDGKGKNMPDELVRRRISSIKGPAELRTYVSLSCTNCPDVVQILNLFALINPGITHTIVDGAVYPEEAEKCGVQAVPSVFASDKLLSVGRVSLADLLLKLEEEYGVNESETKDIESPVRHFDVLILGGGPAGVSAGIYAARKGLNVGMVAKEVGGSVSLTGAIDNLITTRSTVGDKLAKELTGNAAHYGVQIFENRDVEKVDLKTSPKVLYAKGGESFTGDALIIATGATPRRLGIEGEDKYIGKGVAFCPHCDGPYFKDKNVVVIGGGNAGVEAAIDLSALCKHVTVLEFMPEMKADKVLLENMQSLPNVESHVCRQAMEIIGDGKKVTGIVVKDRNSESVKVIETDGVFIQIGTQPNSTIFDGTPEINKQGEIITDRYCRTSIPMVYAAGDVATSPFKQIVVALGEGATASLSAFEDLIRVQKPL